MTAAAKRIVLEVIGWGLVLAGIAALVLPGPGLLMLFAGMAVLSQQYTWAERWVQPIEVRAKKAAADSVQTWPRIIFSVLASTWVLGMGVLWVLDPPAPSWWPLDEGLWLFGGVAAGVTLIASACMAYALIVYSFGAYRGRDPHEVARETEEQQETL